MQIGVRALERPSGHVPWWSWAPSSAGNKAGRKEERQAGGEAGVADKLARARARGRDTAVLWPGDERSLASQRRRRLHMPRRSLAGLPLLLLSKRRRRGWATRADDGKEADVCRWQMKRRALLCGCAAATKTPGLYATPIPPPPSSPALALLYVQVIFDLVRVLYLFFFIGDRVDLSNGVIRTVSAGRC